MAETPAPTTGNTRPTMPGIEGSQLGQGAKIGGYEITRQLGQGGMGAVYLAYQPSLRRYVALKVIAGNADEEIVERFKREARANARLRHPGIVSVHEVGEDAGRHFFTMDYVGGGSLHGLMKRNKGRLPVLRAFEIIRKIVDALAYAHQQGVIHRDLKPQNIMLDDKGEPLIADFGLARLADDVSLSRSGQMVGTPSYMAPEQARGDTRHTDKRADIWSIGAFLYEMVSGTLPFPGSTTLDVVMAIVDEDPVSLRKRHAGLPRDAEAIIFKCLAKDPAKRYQSAEELRDDVDRFLGGTPVLARPVTRWRVIGSWLRRNKALAISASLGILGVTVTLLYTLWLGPALKAAAHRAHIARLEADAAAWASSESARLLKALDDGDVDAVVREAKDVVPKGRLQAAPKDADEKAAVERGLATYAIGPILSRAHFVKKDWPLAARYDPTGKWGLKAQIEIVKKLVADYRLYEAGVALKRIRSRFPGSEAAKDAIAVLGNVLAQQGDLEGALAAYLESGTEPERVEVLKAILGQRQEVVVGPQVSTAEFAPYGAEPFTILKLDVPTLVLPYRKDRPAFRLTPDGLVPVTSPIASLPPSDQINAVCDTDLDMDGRRDVLVAFYRAGTGGGFAWFVPQGGTWVQKHLDLSNAYQPTGLAAGDLDGDGRDEVFVTFMWRSGTHWFIRWDGSKPATSPWHPGLERPWTNSIDIADVDGDGRKELIVGRTTHVGNRVEFFEVRNRRLQLVDWAVVGAPQRATALGDGLLGLMVVVEPDYVTPEMIEKIGPKPESALAILRRKDGRIEPVVRHNVVAGSIHEYTLGNLCAGRLLGKRAIFATSSAGAIDPQRKKSEGQRLRIILGEPTSTPHAMGLPWGAAAIATHDLDADGDSELLVLTWDRILVMGRRTGPPPKLPSVDLEPGAPSEAAALLRGAEDLLSFDSFDAARDLLAEIAERFPSSLEAGEARRLRVDALMRSADLDFAIAGRDADKPHGMEAERRAVEKCRKAAAEAREEAAKSADQPPLRRRFLMLAADASRRALDFDRMRADLDLALQSARSFDDAALESAMKGAKAIVEQAVCIEGDLCRDDLPFLTDAPSRVRRCPGGLEASFDAHSERFIAGVPVNYGGGAMTVSLDLELDSSVWSAGVNVGFIYRESLANQNDHGSVAVFLHGTTEFDKQGAAFRLPFLQFHADRYRGKWRLTWRYLPEANLQTLEIRLAGGELVYSGRSPAAPMLAGEGIFGLAMGYGGGDALFTHQLHPPVTPLRITNVKFEAAACGIDRRPIPTARGFELAAGGALFRGDAKAAAGLYRQALERDARMVRARVNLALATNGSLPIAESLRVDPYETVCAIDDAVRGAQPRHLVALGQILRELGESAKGLPRAILLSFQGDLEEAAVELEKLPDSAAKYYLLRRNQIGTAEKLNESWEWLFSRGMRTAGLALPVIVWAPGPGDTRESLRQELGELSQALKEQATMLEALRAWVVSSRYLLLHPDDVQILQFRSQISGMLRQDGHAEMDLLEIERLRPNDANAHLLLAQHHGLRKRTMMTLQSLEKAVKAGLRDRAPLDAGVFEFLRENPEFKSLRDRLQR